MGSVGPVVGATEPIDPDTADSIAPTRRQPRARPADREPMLRASEVVEYLGVSTRTLRRYAERGLLVPVRLGRTLRYRPADVDAFNGREPEES